MKDNNALLEKNSEFKDFAEYYSFLINERERMKVLLSEEENQYSGQEYENELNNCMGAVYSAESPALGKRNFYEYLDSIDSPGFLLDLYEYAYDSGSAFIPEPLLIKMADYYKDIVSLIDHYFKKLLSMGDSETFDSCLDKIGEFRIKAGAELLIMWNTFSFMEYFKNMLFSPSPCPPKAAGLLSDICELSGAYIYPIISGYSDEILSSAKNGNFGPNFDYWCVICAGLSKQSGKAHEFYKILRSYFRLAPNKTVSLMAFEIIGERRAVNLIRSYLESSEKLETQEYMTALESIKSLGGNIQDLKRPDFPL